MKRSSLTLGVRALIAGCMAMLISGFAQAQTDDSGPYKLRPGDVISISVLEDPLLDRQILVAPDGRISMPLAGSVTASGLTPVGLQSVIRGRLRGKFVEAPTVTVSLISLGPEDFKVPEQDPPNEVYVLGEVNSPGRYQYDAETPITVLQALTLAGGLGPFAAAKRIQVRERTEDVETIRVFNYEALEDGQLATNQDLTALGNNAIIIVPERGLFE